jgi:hypothetical protein
MGQELDDATAELELSAVVPAIRSIIERLTADQAMPVPRHQTLRAVGIRDFLKRKIPAREMLLSPILPERSLSMTYSPRGVGKTWVFLSMGVAIASGTKLLRWFAPRPRKVLHVDGGMSGRVRKQQCYSFQRNPLQPLKQKPKNEFETSVDWRPPFRLHAEGGLY